MVVGITGANGFIGYHTYTYLKYTTNLEPIKLERDFINDVRLKDCDWVIHLAGMNRGDENEIYETNIQLTSDLEKNIEPDTKILFASSTQIGNDSLYAKSKEFCEDILMKSSANHKILRIPNVFGPFCKPEYNSFVATFCHKLCNDEEPKILVDNQIELVFVTDVVKEFILIITDENSSNIKPLYMRNWPHHNKKSATQINVSEVLELLKMYRDTYMSKGSIPKLDRGFHTNLFNTFRSYMKPEDRLISTILHEDERGGLTELASATMSEGLVFTSNTNPGYKRGEHFHTRKFERFCVVEGDAVIRLRKIGTDEVFEYNVSGADIKVIDMPTFYTHNIENTGDELMTAVFWVSELLNKDDADTYWEDV